MSQQRKGKEKASTEDGEIKDSGKSRKGWSDIEKDYLLDLLLAAIRNDEVDGIQSISSAVWNSITIQVNKKFKSNYNKNQVCEQWHNLKMKWKKFHDLKGRSGLKWNDELNMPDIDNAVWDEILKEDKDFGQCKLKGFVHFKKMEQLCAKDSAKDNLAITSQRESKIISTVSGPKDRIVVDVEEGLEGEESDKLDKSMRDATDSEKNTCATSSGKRNAPPIYSEAKRPRKGKGKVAEDEADVRIKIYNERTQAFNRWFDNRTTKGGIEAATTKLLSIPKLSRAACHFA